MRRELSARVTREEEGRAIQVLGRHKLPSGIHGFGIEADEDQDGDPVMWIWLDGEDMSNWDARRREDLSAFMADVRGELFDTLEEYRPHFRLRTVPTAQAGSRP